MQNVYINFTQWCYIAVQNNASNNSLNIYSKSNE